MDTIGIIFKINSMNYKNRCYDLYNDAFTVSLFSIGSFHFACDVFWWFKKSFCLLDGVGLWRCPLVRWLFRVFRGVEVFIYVCHFGWILYHLLRTMLRFILMNFIIPLDLGRTVIWIHRLQHVFGRTNVF